MNRDELILSKIEAQNAAFDAVLARLDPADRHVVERQIAYETECADQESGYVSGLVRSWLDQDNPEWRNQ